ncbi:hypothetical protein ACFSQ7_02320 [Paenibacillus rhizoplanae]
MACLRAGQQPFFSKLLLLLGFSLGAVLITFTLFGTGFSRVLHQGSHGLLFYGTGAVIIFGSSLFLYLLHLTVSLHFGRGASIGIGIAGSLIAALMLTGLGDAMWPYIPFCLGSAIRLTVGLRPYRPFDISSRIWTDCRTVGLYHRNSNAGPPKCIMVPEVGRPPGG